MDNQIRFKAGLPLSMNDEHLPHIRVGQRFRHDIIRLYLEMYDIASKRYEDEAAREWAWAYCMVHATPEDRVNWPQRPDHMVDQAIVQRILDENAGIRPPRERAAGIRVFPNPRTSPNKGNKDAKQRMERIRVWIYQGHLRLSTAVAFIKGDGADEDQVDALLRDLEGEISSPKGPGTTYNINAIPFLRWCLENIGDPTGGWHCAVETDWVPFVDLLQREDADVLLGNKNRA